MKTKEDKTVDVSTYCLDVLLDRRLLKQVQIQSNNF